MPIATVLIPTHNHVEPLRHAIASVQEQTLQDFELLVVGDGVEDSTRKIVCDFAAKDPRIRFFDFPKGPRKGEIHRHEALHHASGRIVAYLGDDDCWMPDHLETLDALLLDADFGHTMHVSVTAASELVAVPADLENPEFRRRMLAELFNCFDLTFAGHTLAAYRRLPEGWRTTPPEFPWTDLYMWRQFLNEPWCRARSAMIPTAICTNTHIRPRLSDEARADDLAYWRAEAAKPEFRERLWRTIARTFARESVWYEIQGIAQSIQINEQQAYLDELLRVKRDWYEPELARLSKALEDYLRVKAEWYEPELARLKAALEEQGLQKR
jgi:glycosyltransferase involved in cell wall biosynthesis